MNEDRWTKIENLVEQALELPPEGRAAFIEKQCGEDEALRNEIHSLLEHGDKALSFIGHFEEDVVAPSIDMMARDQLDEDHRIDTQFGHYHITDILGRGGMGVVYKARDTNLDRTIALKFLPSHLTRSQKDKQRFIREAKAAAALNHSNICTIYSVEDHEGQSFISMEYIDGQTLRQKLESDKITSETALNYAIHIAEALAEAHEKGIIHRDIKPGNIMVDSKDRIKVMDFGLAKLVDSTPITQTGTTLGTMAYMSPEQIQGRPVDHRADLFSFGVLLFEMLTGQRPFGGQYDAALSYSIVNEDPQLLSGFLPNAPQKLSMLITRLLEKDPAKRYSDTENLANELKTCLNQLPDSMETSQDTQSSLQESRSDSLSVSDSSSITINFPVFKSRKGMLSLTAVIVVLVLIGYWLFPAFGSASPSDNTIAVLPLESISTEPEDIQFTDGVHEELINRLAGISELTVIARRSVLGFTPDKRQNLQSIAEQLGVSVLLDGTVRRIGDQLRVSVQLIDANSLATLWSGSFEENIDNVFEIQSRIARQVAGELQASLTADEEQRLDERPTDNSEAYRNYLLGQEYIGRDNEMALELFKKSVEEDPTFVQAWTKLANVYSRLYVSQGRTHQQLEAWKMAAEEAERLDPDLPETKYAVGLYLFWSQTDHRETLDYFESALQEFPNNTDLHITAAQTYRRLGNWEMTVYHYKQALEMDPIWTNVHLGFLYLMMRDYDQAETNIDDHIELFPNSAIANHVKAWIGLSRDGTLDSYERWWNHIRPSDPALEQPWPWGIYNVLKRNWDEALRGFKNIPGETAVRVEHMYHLKDYLIGTALEGQGNDAEARTHYEQVKVYLEELLREYPDEPQYHSELGKVYARLGEVEKAIQAGERATELTPTSQNANTGPYFEFNLAEIYAWTGREDLAIDKLEFCLTVPGVFAHRNWIRLDPKWDPLRDNPRFQELIAGEDEPYLEGL